jgi:spoIIIJ-associated protein
MEWIEVTAKSLDEAVELALDRLGVVADELEYEVLDEPRTGLFGLGRANARIRARVKPLSREKPLDRRRRRRGSEHRSGGNGRSREATAAKVGGGREGERTDGTRTGEGDRSSRDRSAEGTRRRRGRGRNGSRGNRSKATTTTDTNGTRGSGSEAEANDVDDAAVLTIDEQASEATRFTDELVRAFGLDASVAAEVVDDDIELRVEGTSLGVLVGPKGATLHALEELVRAVVQHAAGGQSARLHLDVAGYRQRRREALAAFAQQVANDVITSGAEKALEPMTPPDRKVVHDTISELDGVATTSVGEEPRRRVVIKPA